MLSLLILGQRWSCVWQESGKDRSWSQAPLKKIARGVIIPYILRVSNVAACAAVAPSSLPSSRVSWPSRPWPALLDASSSAVALPRPGGLQPVAPAC